MFHAEGYTEVDVVNGGSAATRPPAARGASSNFSAPNTRILVVALGGNDALRGLTVQQTHDNLAAILDQAVGRRVTIMLAGMLAPTNLGEDYQKGFQERVHPAVARVSERDRLRAVPARRGRRRPER